MSKFQEDTTDGEFTTKRRVNSTTTSRRSGHKERLVIALQGTCSIHGYTLPAYTTAYVLWNLPEWYRRK